MSVSMINKKSACVGSTNAFGLRNNFGKRILSPQYIRLWAKSQQSNAEKFWSKVAGKEIVACGVLDKLINKA